METIRRECLHVRRSILPAAAALLLLGCANPKALTEDARQLKKRVTPAARGIAEGSRRIVRAAGQAADDAALAAKVKGVLIIHKGLDERQIRVSAGEGIVRLTGSVPTVAQKQLAGKVAGATEGVRGVRNRLEVRKSPTASEG